MYLGSNSTNAINTKSLKLKVHKESRINLKNKKRKMCREFKHFSFG